jgi:hypothetical protein
MKPKHVVLFVVLAVGLIFCSISASYLSAITQNYAYASEGLTETEQDQIEAQDQTDTSEEEDTIQAQEESSETQSEHENETRGLSAERLTKDTQGPTIDSRTPSVEAATIPINTDITVTFNEPIKPSSANTATILLRGIDGKINPGTVSLSQDGKTATFDATSVLAYLQSYTVSLTSGIKDLVGNSFISEKWSFTTEAQPSSGDGGNAGSGSDDAGFENVGDSLGLVLPNSNLDAAKTQSTSANNNLSDNGVINKDVITLPKGKAYIQLLNDAELVDRILPLIVEKIDVNMLIAKADGQQLLKKVLPYLDVKVTAYQREGDTKSYKLGSGGSNSGFGLAKCESEDQLVGGGIWSPNSAIDGIWGSVKLSGAFPEPSGDTWRTMYFLKRDDTVTVYAQCVKTEVGIKQILP